MPKVAINACIGGFRLSAKAVQRLMDLGSPYIKSIAAERRDPEVWPDYIYKDSRAFFYGDSPDELETRTNELLMQVLGELGTEAFGDNGRNVIKVVDIPEDIEWSIYESDDGHEWVAEKHRTWS